MQEVPETKHRAISILSSFVKLRQPEQKEQVTFLPSRFGIQAYLVLN
jgi:hypothetical protein